MFELSSALVTVTAHYPCRALNVHLLLDIQVISLVSSIQFSIIVPFFIYLHHIPKENSQTLFSPGWSDASFFQVHATVNSLQIYNSKASIFFLLPFLQCIVFTVVNFPGKGPLL